MGLTTFVTAAARRLAHLRESEAASKKAAKRKEGRSKDKRRRRPR
jgi:hypothetical protein